MSSIRSRKHAINTIPASKPNIKNSTLLTASSLITMSALICAPVQAEQHNTTSTAEAPQTSTENNLEKNAQTLPEVKVTSPRKPPYKAEKSASPKATQPLVDTPQTISIIKKEVFKEQAASNVTDALRNTPGITLQLGENGNTSAGDTIQMRGFSAQTSMFIDGVRDLGAITRDTFNIDQIEVVKGAAGADIGRGSAAGYINLVTKLPTQKNSIAAEISATTGNSQRITTDINQGIGETSALRINAMGQRGGVDKRDTVKNNSFAIAPSFASGLGTPTRFYIYTQHVRQDNIPDGGIPTIGMPGFYNAARQINQGSKIDRENFYGNKNDYEKVNADMASVKVEHDLSEKTTIRNISRFGKTTMDRILTGVNAIAAPNLNDPSTWTVARTRQRTDQSNQIFANQTNLNSEFKTGWLTHNFSGGIEFMHEKQYNKLYSTTGLNITPANLYNPNSNASLIDPYATGGYTDGATTTAAIYAFDTLKFNDYFELNAGGRFEHYKTTTNSVTATQNSTTGAITALTPARLSKSDNLFSWKLGAIVKPTKDSSIYLSYATAKQPPGGANFALSSTASSADNINLDPQETTNLELGTKWDVIEKKLALTAAVYRTTNKNEVSYNALDANYYPSGKRRVQGIELGAVGQITRDWQITAGLATMHTKVLEGSTFSSNTNTTTNNAGGEIRWSPKLTATIWSSYNINKDFTLGGGVRYVSEQKRVVTPGVDLATQNMPSIPSYWVTDLMASYKFTNNFALQLNINNVFNKTYINTLNNSGARMTLGTPRSAVLTAKFNF